MNRLEAFETLFNDAFFGPKIAKLSQKDISFCREFLGEHLLENREQFTLSIQKYISQTSSEQRPKKWSILDELLLVCTTKAG